MNYLNKMQCRGPLLLILVVVCTAVTVFYHYQNHWGWGFSVILLLLAGFVGLIFTEQVAREARKDLPKDQIKSTDDNIGKKYNNEKCTEFFILNLVDPGNDPVAILRVIQAAAGLKGSEAKSLLLTKNFPAQIIRGSKDQIEASATMLQKAGATIRISQA